VLKILLFLLPFKAMAETHPICDIYVCNSDYTGDILTLKMTTFNLRWYGLGGKQSGRPEDEYRAPWLAEYMKSEESGKVADSDVISFQEVIDVNGVKKIMRNHNCISYDHPSPTHQHVVLCAKKPLDWVIDGGDDNFAWEEVALPGGKLRPALHAYLSGPSKTIIAHIVAVHLKAGSEFSSLRTKQAKILSYLMDTKLNDGKPVILLGDFNTHIAKYTGQEKDDADLLSEVFKASALNFYHVPNKSPTYRTERSSMLVDHFWHSQNAHIWSSIFIPEVCDPSAEPRQDRYSKISFYNRYVSDHCPVTNEMQIALPEWEWP
jgi:hypothetical protein